nr:receptor-like protein Cf-9 homolog [Solanum lycopersicum]
MLQNLTNLEVLSLSQVIISSPLPVNISSSLRHLDLKHTNLLGVLTKSSFLIPNSLETLKLSGNLRLEGVLPKRNTLLTELDISYTGRFITQLLKQLSSTLLGKHGFTNGIGLKKEQSHKVLDVGNNAINDTFPAWLGILQELQVLILKSNKFHGPISTCHTEFCFTKLRIFDLSRNDFSGSLPAKVFGNFKAMIKLDGEDIGNIKYMTSLLNSPFVTSYENSVSLVIKGQDL